MSDYIPMFDLNVLATEDDEEVGFDLNVMATQVDDVNELQDADDNAVHVVGEPQDHHGNDVYVDDEPQIHHAGNASLSASVFLCSFFCSVLIAYE
jgi:hypothetical protein